MGIVLKNRRLSIVFSLSLCVGLPGKVVFAAPGNLANVPLYLFTKTTPNVFFEIDDSGSMDWEILAKRHWEPCAYDSLYSALPGSDDCGTTDRIVESMVRSLPGSNYSNGKIVDPNGLLIGYPYAFSEYHYIFNNADNIYNVANYAYCTGNWAWGPAITPNLESCQRDHRYYEWRAFSSGLNVLYYNPAVTYRPWVNGDGTAMADASFTQARSTPVATSNGYDLKGYDLIRDLTGFVYEVWKDSHGYSGSRPRRGANINRTEGANGQVDFWDEHDRYTVNANDITIEHIKYTVSWSGELVKQVTTETVTSLPGVGGGPNIPLVQVKQNIANWYQYYRRRIFAVKAAVGQVIDDNPNFRYGLNTINVKDFFTQVPDAANPPFQAHNIALISNFHKYNLLPEHGYAMGTPLRSGLNRAGEYFQNADGRSPAPIVESCQQNYTILFTDGLWNHPELDTSVRSANPRFFWDPISLPNKIADNDGDGKSQTLADISRYYYLTDLNPNMPDNVVPHAFDPLKSQHMVTYTIAFGVEGLLSDTDNDGWPLNSPGLVEHNDWGNPFTNSAAKVDDVWHAAYNAKGNYVNASSPQVVSRALQDALNNISDRDNSSAGLAIDSNLLSSNATLFQVKFRNNTGDVVAYGYDEAKHAFILTAKWSAAAQLDAQTTPHTNRVIITHDGSKGVAFLWDNLSLLQQADLMIEPNGWPGTAINKGKARLDYLRGDKANEFGVNGVYSFRKRTSLLGDIIHSTPVVVGKPKAQWPDSAPFPTSSGQTYSNFVQAQANRPEILYTGANDGMLHGFKTASGDEAIAYIPHFLSSLNATQGLHYLTDYAYSHRYYVDMPPVVEDAYFNSGTGTAWHSVLIGGARGGGKGLFALDVTDPSMFLEANAAKIALWEFSSLDNPNMGYSYSVPTIALLNNNRWAAIFGNGYNNNGDGQAKLFILFLDGGIDGTWAKDTDYIELSTNVGTISAGKNCADSASDCNGLSTPQTVDTDADQRVDRVYAGDVKGNLWAFDLSDADPNKWAVAYSGKPLFKAGQPITGKPAVIPHPTQTGGAAPNLMVFFGTGQYLTVDDLASKVTQGFYGVWDHGKAEITTATLVQQTFENKTFYTTDANGNKVQADDFRVLSQNQVDYASKDGWYIALTDGERSTTNPLIYREIVIFSTRIPASTACSSGGGGSIMFVDQVTGGRTDFNLFDIDQDHKVSSADNLKDGSNIAYAPSGIMLKEASPEQINITGTSALVPLNNATFRNIELYDANSGGAMRRISWQQHADE